MAAASKTTISFSLVSIPIAMYTAVQDNDIHFNQLHKDDHQRIRYKKTCGHCGQEVSSKDIVKGYAYDDDKYVIITDDDFEKIKTEKDKSIQIQHFVNLDEISPIYFNKAYYALPEAGGDKAFELLRYTMKEENKIAIGKAVLGNSEQLLALIPTSEGILVETMYFEEEIKDIPKTINHPELSKEEVKMATTLINSMDKPFQPEDYKDEYQARLRELIEQKIAGKEVVAAEKQESTNVINLMDALQASIEKNGIKPKKRTRAKTKAGV